MTKLCSISLALLSFSTNAQVIDRLLAVVGDQPILKSDIQTLKSDLKQNPHLASSFNLKKDEASDDTLVELLINQSIIRQVLKDNKLDIKDEDVIKQVSQIASQNNMSLDQLKTSLHRENINYQSYLNSIKIQLEKRTIFDNDIRHSAGAAISEADLKNEFLKTAQTEWSLLLLIKKNSPENQARLQELIKNINSGALSIEALKKQEKPENLGWVSPSSLQARFQEALKGKKDGEAAGPILTNNSLHALIVESSRRGSEEQFQAAKEELSRQFQGKQVDGLFKAWLDKKRLETELVINK
ncbi:MAG: SurA N-terminal domain-containing protein [Proteobacteria bacterium]|nr:SurA N-terminal domain-containing protein [Pseudomonadota bacterium]